MIAMACEQVASESLPAVMCLDPDGVPLFATQEGHRLCDRWNSGLQDADLPQSARDFRMPAAIGTLLSGVLSRDESPARGARALVNGLRLRHPALPDLAVTVELGSTLPDRRTSGCLLVFTDGDAEAANEQEAPERHKVLGQLTPSERKVAMLVAEGLRNGEIAERLQRSRRTIEYQLNAIYRKLDLSCRTQLVRVLI